MANDPHTRSFVGATSVRALVGFMLLLACGCYAYVPAELSDVRAGHSVRLRISGTLADSLETLLPDIDRTFEGEVAEVTDDALLVDVPTTSTYAGMRLQTLRQRLDLPATGIVEIEARELSRGRTAIALGAVGAIVGGIVISQLTGDTGGGERPGTGGPVEAVVTLPTVGIPIAGLPVRLALPRLRR